jgi:hypothetical protein
VAISSRRRILIQSGFLEVLEYFGTLSVLLAVVSHFSESKDRIKQKQIRLGRSLTPHKEREAVAEELMPWRNSMRTACRWLVPMSAAHSSKALISAEQICCEQTFARLTCEVGILTVRTCSMALNEEALNRKGRNFPEGTDITSIVDSLYGSLHQFAVSLTNLSHK